MACTNSPRQALTALTVYVDSPRQALTGFGLSDSPRQALTPVTWHLDSPRQALTRMLASEFFLTYVEPDADTLTMVPL